MNIHSYYTEGGKDLILSYILALPMEERIDGLSVLENIENNQMDSLMVKVWEKKVLEVYFRKHNRIYYVVQDDENIYLLFAGRKQKNKTEKKDARLIRNRAKELGKILNRKFV
ncbi:MAG: type II toxin-antitoxin system RelE/ParE family toxin [Hespellia sp.]|nr:type II toxin-antitoxin system RelE/ParE family toxin [Hespellia sp.]